MRHVLLAAVFAFSLGIQTTAQTSSGKSPLPGDVTARVDGVFEKWNRTDSPGCALSVMKDGQIIYKHGYGMADLDHDVTIKPSTVFHVASMSKQFTAAAIVLLAQQGKLSLDDDIHKFIPELPDFGAKIAIRHLIYHTSGIRDQWELLDLDGWRYSLDLITDDDIMSLLVRQKQLNFKPGDKQLYSNTGYTLLGLIVKRVSGMSLREFTTKNIFEPLGMNNTHFRDDHAEIVKNNAYGYDVGNNGAIRLSNTQFDTVGATSLHTTVEDLALWDENFYHPRIGGANFLPQMLERGKLNSGEQLDYAFGLQFGKYRGLETIDHAGADAGYRSELTRFPDQHFSAAVLCNSSDTAPNILIERIADIYLATDMKASRPISPTTAPIALSAQRLSEISGLYWDREGDQFMQIYSKEGALHVKNAYDDVVLKPINEGLFHPIDPPYGDYVNIAFEPAAQGKPGRISETFEDGKPQVYESVDGFNPTAKDLTEYDGDYVSQEIDPVYHISVEDGKLTLSRLKHKADVLNPGTRDTFFGSIGTVRFTRDSFVLDGGRVRDFHFGRRTN